MDSQTEVIKMQMEETRSALAEKLETLEQHVVGTVQEASAAVTGTVTDVRAAVQDTIGTVKDSVEETVTSVKNTFDLSRQVEQHPWIMLGGSVAAGYIVGRLLNRSAPAGNGD